MPFALAASFLTAAPVSCIPLRSASLIFCNAERSRSITQQAAVHPLPLLCSPALSFGLRVVMPFCILPYWPTHFQLLSINQPTQAKRHANPCSFRSVFRSHSFAAFTSLIVRTALRFVPSLRALCSHPHSCSRDSFHSVPFTLGRLAIRQRPSHY
jgi:hypothetical protein